MRSRSQTRPPAAALKRATGSRPAFLCCSPPPAPSPARFFIPHHCTHLLPLHATVVVCTPARTGLHDGNRAVVQPRISAGCSTTVFWRERAKPDGNRPISPSHGPIIRARLPPTPPLRSGSHGTRSRAVFVWPGWQTLKLAALHKAVHLFCNATYHLHHGRLSLARPRLRLHASPVPTSRPPLLLSHVISRICNTQCSLTRVQLVWRLFGGSVQLAAFLPCQWLNDSRRCRHSLEISIDCEFRMPNFDCLRIPYTSM
jgi:hypothetical protein